MKSLDAVNFPLLARHEDGRDRIGKNAFFVSEGLGFGCCIFTGSCKDNIFNNEKAKANRSMFG